MNRKHHYSIYVSDPAAQKLLERQENKSGFIAQLVSDYAAGEIVPATDMKQRKIAAEAKLAEAKLAAFDDDRALKREAIRADINLKVQAGHLSSINFQRALERAPGAQNVKQYILPSASGDALDMFCPVCFRVTASNIHVQPDVYTQAKMQTIRHAVDVHGANAQRFDPTFPQFANFERLIFGEPIMCAATADELDSLFRKTLPAPGRPDA